MRGSRRLVTSVAFALVAIAMPMQASAQQSTPSPAATDTSGATTANGTTGSTTTTTTENPSSSSGNWGWLGLLGLIGLFGLRGGTRTTTIR